MYNVLIADDEPAIIHGLCSQISWESLSMELAGTVQNGEDALSIISKSKIHLLITDVCMPSMDGLELISRARLVNPDIRCILISAHNDFEYVKNALKQGVDNYILKPINPEELYETLVKIHANLEQDKSINRNQTSDMMAFRLNILERWVNGSIQNYELKERAEIINFNLSSAGFLVCIFNITETNDAGKRLTSAHMLNDICKTILTENYTGEFFIDSSLRVACVLYVHPAKFCRDELSLQLRKIHNTALSKGLKIYCSCGDLVNTYSDVSISYASAVFYQKYHLMDKAGFEVFGSDFPDFLFKITIENSNILQKYIDAIKDDDFGKAKAAMQQYIDTHARKPLQYILKSSVPFILSALQTIIESGKVSEDLPDCFKSILSEFSAINSDTALTNWCTEFTKNAIQVIRERKGTLNLYVKLALKHVKQHYREEISLSTLAASFNISPAYLGQLFKAETGQFFNDYITEVRLQASLSLLTDSNLKIGDIANQIGLQNQSYFNRIFRKTYGVTPAEFRHQKQG